MVGYNEAADHQLSEFWQGFAGVTSGVVSRVIIQPLDVLKIRFQLQHEPLKKSAKNYYWGIHQASFRIFKEETYRALWKGHVPAQVLSGIYGLSQFLTFEFLTKLVSKSNNALYKKNKNAVHFTCGCISGGMATIISMPFDTVRTRLVGQGEPKTYKGVIHAFTTMIKTEGILSLYKGLTPNLIQIVPHTGIQFAVFNIGSELYTKLIPDTDAEKKLPVYGSLICGAFAGLVAKTAVYPLDLAKKRLQVQGFQVARARFGKFRPYSGMSDCLKSTFLEEGITGLYKGLTPSCLKAMVASALIFTIYEETTSILKSLKL